MMLNFNVLDILSNFFKTLEKSFWSLWWVFAIQILGLITLEQGLKVVHQDIEHLKQQYQSLTIEKEKARTLQETLKLQINSQSDPAWVELTLKKGLGLVPEGQIKVFFTE